MQSGVLKMHKSRISWFYKRKLRSMNACILSETLFNLYVLSELSYQMRSASL